MRIVVDEMPKTESDCCYSRNIDCPTENIYDCHYDKPFVSECHGVKECPYFVGFSDIVAKYQKEKNERIIEQYDRQGTN